MKFRPTIEAPYYIDVPSILGIDRDVFKSLFTVDKVLLTRKAYSSIEIIDNLIQRKLVL